MDIIDDILRLSYRTDDNWVKNYIRFLNDIPQGAIDDLTSFGLDQRSHVDDLLGMLAQRGRVDGRRGIEHLLDIYRRMAEVSRPFVKVLSDCIKIVEGEPRPHPELGFGKRCEIIRASSFGDLVRNLDPDIRNSESHTGTSVDMKQGKVVLTKLVDIGNREIVKEYTLEEICNLTWDLYHNLVPAFIMSFHIHEVCMILVILYSKEYIDLLLSIDNLRE